MSEDKLTVTLRTDLGKQAAKRTRKGGRTPAVIYGGAADPMPVQIDTQALEAMLRHGSLTRVVPLDIDGGENCQVLMRSPVRHPVSLELLHVDMFRVTASSRVTVDVPIVLTGVAEGVLAGGVLDQVLHTIHLECLASNIPEKIEVDVTNLEINDNIHVSTLEIPDATIMNDPSAAIVTCAPPRVIEEEVEAEEGIEELEEGAEPEVIGAKEEDDDDDEDGTDE